MAKTKEKRTARRAPLSRKRVLRAAIRLAFGLELILNGLDKLREGS